MITSCSQRIVNTFGIEQLKTILKQNDNEWNKKAVRLILRKYATNYHASKLGSIAHITNSLVAKVFNN